MNRTNIDTLLQASEEISRLKKENRDLSFRYQREKIRTLDLQAIIEEAEEKKLKEEDRYFPPSIFLINPSCYSLLIAGNS
jgi:hypothetical protein